MKDDGLYLIHISECIDRIQRVHAMPQEMGVKRP